MKTQRMSSVLMLTMAGLLATVSMKGCDKKAKAAEEAAPVAPEGYVLVQEDILTYLVDGPKEHFTKAHDDFLKMDYHMAVGQIRKGTAYLKLQATRATPEGKKVLNAAIADLDRLAGDVEKGGIKEVKALDQCFARAHYALAQHHYLKAKEHHSRRMATKAGHALNAATIHLENGAEFAGHQLDASSKKVIKDAEALSGKLIEGTGGAIEEAGKGIDAVGDEIAKLGNKVEPGKATPTR